MLFATNSGLIVGLHSLMFGVIKWSVLASELYIEVKHVAFSPINELLIWYPLALFYLCYGHWQYSREWLLLQPRYRSEDTNTELLFSQPIWNMYHEHEINLYFKDSGIWRVVCYQSIDIPHLIQTLMRWVCYSHLSLWAPERLSNLHKHP